LQGQYLSGECQREPSDGDARHGPRPRTEFNGDDRCRAGLLRRIVAECGKYDTEDEDSLVCLIRGVDVYGRRRLGLRRADELRGARVLLRIGGLEDSPQNADKCTKGGPSSPIWWIGVIVPCAEGGPAQAVEEV
jgi:hypothetical protein